MNNIFDEISVNEATKDSVIKTLWRKGSWELLHYIPFNIADDSSRPESLLFLSVAHTQLGDLNSASKLVENALAYGTEKKFLKKILVSCALISLGRIAAINGRNSLAKHYFRSAAKCCLTQAELKLFLDIRVETEFARVVRDIRDGLEVPFRLRDTNNKCYFCCSSKTTILGVNLDFNTNIYKCDDCELIQNDCVSSQCLQEYYRKEYRQARKEVITEAYLEFMTSRAVSQREFVTSVVKGKMSDVLDIGAGAGKLIEQFIDKDTNTYAIESDSAMALYISKNSQIHLLNGNKLLARERRFDLIMMSHVFEHVNNPIHYLSQLGTLLKEEGYLFIEVPYEPEEVISHHLKQGKRGIGHLFDYTTNTLKKMISRVSLFEIITLATYGINIEEYIKGESIKNFDINTSGKGIFIRVILKKR
ncbi:MAG: class I SAM-dependent methyltransferase [Bacteroidetes bacterium]|nr:class I SAM-dependent methyltransferase [Bacteroidota bacterium]